VAAGSTVTVAPGLTDSYYSIDGTGALVQFNLPPPTLVANGQTILLAVEGTSIPFGVAIHPGGNKINDPNNPGAVVASTVFLTSPGAIFRIKYQFATVTWWAMQYPSGGGVSFGSPIEVAAGVTQSLGTSAFQIVYADPTGSLAAIVQMPPAPGNDNVVLVIPVDPTSPAIPNPIVGGVGIVARGGALIGDCSNPGSFMAANGSVKNATWGPTWYQYEAAKTRWVQII